MADSSARRVGRARMLVTLTVALAATMWLALGSAPALAADSTDSIVDHDGHTIQAILSDMSIQMIQPIDGNPLTREWLQNGRAGYKVTGKDAAKWSGRVAIGYQVGYTASLSGNLKFGWDTPNLSWSLCPSGCGPSINNLLPSAGVSVQVGFGPGITTVQAATGSVNGSEGYIQLGNFHGTVTGVVGPLNIVPWVTVVSGHGDSITTYGDKLTF